MDDKDFKAALLRALAGLQKQAEANTRYIDTISARVAGVDGHSHAVAEVVDSSAEIAARKEIISHLYEKSHQYVATLIAGAYAAYFATLGVLSGRFSDDELRTSALLMTVSLTVFVAWEIGSMATIGYHAMRGDLGQQTEVSRWQRIGWPLAMFLSIANALPAVALSVHVYLRGLGAYEAVTHALNNF